jgi:hypothetical protein
VLSAELLCSRLKNSELSTQNSQLVVFLSLPHIKLIHCHRYSSMNETFQGLNSAVETGGQNLDLFPREWLQHIVCRILTRRRSADSDLDPHKLGGPDRVDDRLDPIVAPMPTGLFDAETPQIKIKIVMDENQIVGSQRTFTQKAFERGTGDVHPVEGTGEFEKF